MKSKLKVSVAFTAFLGLTSTSYAVWPEAGSELAKSIEDEINYFSKHSTSSFEDKKSEQCDVMLHESEDKKYYGLSRDGLEKVDYAGLKKQIVSDMRLPTNRLVQVVGSSKPFSQQGTEAARKFLNKFLVGDHIIEYGFTGHAKPLQGQLDINSLVSEFVEQNPKAANRVLANVVGHTVVALNDWGCSGHSKISHYVVVFNKYGMNEGFTKFGDDVIASDFIMSAKDDDLLVLIEGGWQSFKQSLNALSLDVKIEALFNVREEADKKLFSTAELFHIIKNSMEKTPNMSKEELAKLFESYMKTHEAWDKNRPDASTKELLYKTSVKQFLDSEVYKRILTHVNVVDMNTSKL